MAHLRKDDTHIREAFQIFFACKNNIIGKKKIIISHFTKMINVSVEAISNHYEYNKLLDGGPWNSVEGNYMVPRGQTKILRNPPKFF